MRVSLKFIDMLYCLIYLFYSAKEKRVASLSAKWLFTLSLMILSSLLTGQTSMREIIVTADTSFETNKLSKKFEVSENTGINGLRVTVIDNPFVIFHFNNIFNHKLDGVHFTFYIPSGMPREKGSYKGNKKEGEWFFWSESGVLVRKELWKTGKLVKVVTFVK